MEKSVFSAAVPVAPVAQESAQVQAPVLPRLRAAVLGPRLALVAILALAAFLNLFQLTSEGYGNSYYAASVKSMLTSWHNFFFASFDSGFVTVDKPPLGFWIQAASAKIFGFQGWSLILPQALVGVAAVGVVFHLVRGAFGQAAGLLAALTLTLTPISVALSRHNNLEGLLVLVVLLAAWAFVLATESGRVSWLLTGALLLGVGFNIKMLEAFLVVPACYLVFFLGAPVSWQRRIVHLAAATVVLVAVSLSWAIAVDLTPADQRPYVSTTENNTVMDLILGFNGANRLTGDDNDVGARGPLRLVTTPLVEQIGWLLPVAIVGLAAAGWQAGARFPLDRQQQGLVLWGTWLIPQVIFFSIAGDWDPHYLAMLAPAVAALVGIGLVALWHDYRSPSWRGWILPATLIVTVGLHFKTLVGYGDWQAWSRSAIAVPGLAAVVGLVIARLQRRLWGTPFALAAMSVGVAALLIAPALWAASTIWYGGETRAPTAGPRPPRDRVASSQFQHDAAPLLTYLQAHRGDAHYLIAAADRDVVRYMILNTNEAVIALGGFKGHDPVLSAERLERLVAEGAVRYFLLESRSRRKDEAARWIMTHCAQVPKSAWQLNPSASGKRSNGIDDPLYDCTDALGVKDPMPA